MESNLAPGIASPADRAREAKRRRGRSIGRRLAKHGRRVACVLCHYRGRWKPEQGRLRNARCPSCLQGDGALRTIYYIRTFPELARARVEEEHALAEARGRGRSNLKPIGELLNELGAGRRGA